MLLYEVATQYVHMQTPERDEIAYDVYWIQYMYIFSSVFILLTMPEHCVIVSLILEIVCAQHVHAPYSYPYTFAY